MFNQIEIKLKASWLLACLLALPVLSSFALILSSSLPIMAKVTHLTLGLAVILYLLWHQALLLSPGAVNSIQVKDQRLLLGLNNGQTLTAQLRQRTFIHPYLCIFYFKLPNHHSIGFWTLSNYRFVIAFNYNTHSTESLRRLRARVLHDAPSLALAEPLLNQE